MEVTTELVAKYIDAACEIIADCFTGFTKPKISKIELTRAHCYWANITKMPDGWRVRISKNFSEIPDEMLFQERMMSCMIHEMIHTIDKCCNHGEAFQYIANRINSYYPEYHVCTSTSAIDYGLTENELPNKYVVTCTHCHTEYKYKRKPKIWNYINQSTSPYECGTCGHSTFSGKII